jgi:WS/DGAT/MGAT family acyltransferase
MGANRHPISKVDTAWLRMEQPANLMMITGMVFFDQMMDFDDLLDVIEKRFLAFPRFRHKAVVGTRQCYWEEDVDFDIRNHVRRTALPGAADLFELQELVSELASTPLDHSKPLWQFHLVENFEGGPVLVARIHHCYADGIALIQVLLSLTDTDPAGHQRPRSKSRYQQRKAAESNIFKRLMEPAKEGIDVLSHWGMKLVEEGSNLIRDPKAAADYASLAGEMADELAGALLLSDDPHTRFKGRLGPRKRVAWAPPLDLAEVKSLSRALRCTVNDVLIATITGALRQYLVDHGDDVDDLEIRATVPVNLRPLEHAKELGNHFGLVFLPLPVGEEDPLSRLRLVHNYMNELKSSKQAAVAFGLLAALGMGPARLQKPMLDMMSRKASTVLTNVPGPRQSLFLAGSEVSEMMFWVPQSGNIGMGISILSYNGKVYCGLMTDRRLVPEPMEIVNQFAPEFEKLLYLTLMMDEEALEGSQSEAQLQDIVHGTARQEALDASLAQAIQQTEPQDVCADDQQATKPKQALEGTQAASAATSATSKKAPAQNISTQKKSTKKKASKKVNKKVSKKAAKKTAKKASKKRAKKASKKVSKKVS